MSNGRRCIIHLDILNLKTCVMNGVVTNTRKIYLISFYNYLYLNIYVILNKMLFTQFLIFYCYFCFNEKKNKSHLFYTLMLNFRKKNYKIYELFETNLCVFCKITTNDIFLVCKQISKHHKMSLLFSAKYTERQMTSSLS